MESLDQLQQQLKLEEAVEQELANESDLLDEDLFLSKEVRLACRNIFSMIPLLY